ncbi:OmpW family outer membrane protein [Pyruvatibacter sp.]|uniref:OmpW/AlkL family protein n=1 Tax=Pyruvatibacter sp. TaxID=1981328 RepID=UPI0032EBB111
MQSKTILKSLATALLAATALTALPATTALAEDGATSGQSPWMIRGRIIGVIPDESSSVTPNIGSIEAEGAVVPEIDITYFFTPNIAAELIAATSPHDMSVNLNGGGTLDLGDVWVLPPTLLLQYHFIPDGQIRPYAGVGINYTHLYNADDTAGTSVDYDGGFGWALQAGVDVPISGNWSWNLDVKKIFVNVDATVNSAVRADVDLDPWVIGTGVGYRF